MRRTASCALILTFVFISMSLSGYSCDGNAPGKIASSSVGPGRASAAGVDFYYSNDATYLTGTLEARSSGWLGVGFGGNTMGTVGRVVIGMVSGVTHEVEVQSISGRTHLPVPGVKIESRGVDIDGVTTITFKIALADLGMEGLSGKTIPIILARNDYTKNFTIYHSGTRGSATITLY